MAIGEKRQRVNQMQVPFHRVEVPNRHDQPVACSEPQLVADRCPVRRDVPHAVRDRRDVRSRDEQVVAHLVGQVLRHGDGGAAQRERGAQRRAALETPGIVPAAVHRDDVLAAGKPRGHMRHKRPSRTRGCVRWRCDDGGTPPPTTARTPAKRVDPGGSIRSRRPTLPIDARATLHHRPAGRRHFDCRRPEVPGPGRRRHVRRHPGRRTRSAARFAA